MRKFYVVLALFSFSSVSFAVPKAGDQIVLSGVTTYQGAAHALKVELELTQYNPAANANTVHQRSYVDGVLDSESDLIYENSELLPVEEVENVLAKCGRDSTSRLEEVATPAGAVPTCHFMSGHQGQDIWVGAVPFGLVQMYADFDDPPFRLTVESYKFGN